MKVFKYSSVLAVNYESRSCCKGNNDKSVVLSMWPNIAKIGNYLGVWFYLMGLWMDSISSVSNIPLKSSSIFLGKYTGQVYLRMEYSVYDYTIYTSKCKNLI